MVSMHLLSQDDPSALSLEMPIIAARPGSILVAATPAFPGGGGQLPDRATLTWPGGEAALIAMRPDPRGWWHDFAGDALPSGVVRIVVEPAFRRLMSELHTLAHIANSVVYRDFGGALLTGAQLSADGTFRVDFDLSGTETPRLRDVDAAINAECAADRAISASWMDWDEAAATPGLFRSKSVTPPRGDDGLVRIVEIAGLDRQGCGGTHLSRTGAARRVQVLKVDNKGRQNRRVKFGLVA
jgi:misacylated tRNA(Ala) deacylase